METLVRVAPSSLITHGARGVAGGATVFFDPRALDVNEISLPCLTFTNDSYLAVVQKSAEPLEFQLIVCWYLPLVSLRNVSGCNFLQELAGNQLRRLRALKYASLAMRAFRRTWRFPRPAPRKFANPIRLKNAGINMGFRVVELRS